MPTSGGADDPLTAQSAPVRPASEPPPSPPLPSPPKGARAPHQSLPPGIDARTIFVEACGLAVACCLIGSLPAALRAAREGGSFIGGLVAATAVVLPLVALAISLSRAAGRGFRLVMGLQAGRGTAAGLGLWVGLMAPILILLGSILKEKTNHRGLGGGTFGVLALAVTVGAALLAHRIVESGRWLVGRGVSPRAVATMIALLSVGPMLVVSFPLLARHDISPDAHAVAAALIDGVIFTLAASVAVTFDVGDRARGLARRFGLPAAAAFMITGIAWLSVSPSLGGAMRAGGGLSAA
ncbi:MAG: cell wall anchor protein, partial [Myxococcales bacterium]|nr:cell wall anchor protein [Myxococcales bacterium]